MFQLHVSSAPQWSWLQWSWLQWSWLQWPWLLILANIAIASLLVCGLTLLVERLWPRRTLPLRHTILLAGLFVTLAIPAIVGAIDAAGFSLVEITTDDAASAIAFTHSAPPLNEVMSAAQKPLQPDDLQASVVERPSEQGGSPQFPAGAATNGSADHAIERALDPPAEPIFTWRRLLWAGLALASIWLIGGLYELYRFALGLFQVRRFQQTIEPVTDPRLQRLARAAAQSVGLTRCPPLGQSLAIETPVSLGALRGQVVLPARQLHEWSDDAWRALLVHEMAHVRRRDPLVGFLQRVAIVLYWWNPLLRCVSTRIAVLREQICDDLVTQHGSQEDRYAALIVELAGRVTRQRNLGPVLGAADGTPSELALRIRRLLDPNRQFATTLSRAMKCAVGVFSIALVFCVGGTSIRWARAQESAAEHKDQQLDAVAKKALTALADANDAASLEKQVRIVDQNDQPVVGAKITPWAIRSATGHGPWSALGKGRSEPPVVTSGADGIATIPFPRYVEPEEKLPAQQLTCRVEHPDFAVSTYNDVPVAPAEREQLTTIKVAPGAKVVVQPTAEGVEFERDRLFALWSSPTPTFAVHVTDDGKLELPRLAPGDELLRVAYLPKQGPAMFSEVLSEKLENGREYALAAALQPAVSVTGQLDDSVPRPVKNGIIVGTIMNKTPVGAASHGSLHWRVWSPIREDGTFTLGPVPTDQLQVIAICDGYMAASGKQPDFAAEKLHDSFNYPQVFAVSAANQAITLKMTPTTECAIRVLDSAGKPIRGAKCISYPNVKWWDGGSQIYCHPLFSSIELLEGMQTKEISRRMMEPTRFEAFTAADGVAVVKNLPPREEGFVVIHDDFEMPIDGNRREVQVDLHADGSHEVTVTMQPKGTQHLGDLPAALLEACATPASKSGTLATETATVKEDPTAPTTKPVASADTSADLLHKKIRVVDEQGRPIAGATVTPWAIRDALGSHGSWAPNNMGRSEPPILTTDAEGRATIPFPRYSDPSERVPPVHITCRIEHPGFVQTIYNDALVKEAELGAEQTFVLQVGAQVEIVALDGEKQLPTERLFAQWSSDTFGLKSTVSTSGALILPRLPAGEELVRVAYLPETGPAMFSDVQSLKLASGERYPLRVAMRPALKILGKLDDSVPRPVKNGRIVAEVIHQAPSRRVVEWRTWSAIAEDGTFTLEPVPSGELQVIGLCEGFSAKNGEVPTFAGEKGRPSSRIGLPQVFAVDPERQQITLQMTPTADCKIRVVDADGKPVPDAWVGFSPNVRWWNGGSQTYCKPLLSTAQTLTAQGLFSPGSAAGDQFLFGAQTGADGVAVVRNLPVYDATFVVGNDKYELPIEKQKRWGRILLKPGADNEITVRVQPKGKEFLGDVSERKVTAIPAATTLAAAPAPARTVVTHAEPTELAGVVVDEQGQPLADVKVDAYTWFPGNETKTDQHGRFSLKGFDNEEELETEFTKPGYSPSLFVKRKAGGQNWIVILTQGTSLQGRVLDPQGTPVPKAAVRAWRGRVHPDGRVTNPVWTDTVTDEAGRYHLDLEPANYTIEVRVPGVGVARERKVRLAPKEVKSLDLKLSPGVTFDATVRNSITGDPVAGLILWHSRDVVGISDSQGKLTITNLVPGEYKFQVTAEGSNRLEGGPAGPYARWWSPQAKLEWQREEVDKLLVFSPNDPIRKDKKALEQLKRDMGIDDFQRNFDDLTYDLTASSVPVEVFVEPAATISGRVIDPDGKPVAGATVEPAKTGYGTSLTGDTRYSVATDPQGNFTMKVPAGKDFHYHLIAHDGKYQEWRNWANGLGETMHILPGDNKEGIELRLTRGGIVRGKVLTRNGTPRANVRVRAIAADRRDCRYYVPTTRTDEDGRYELRLISPGVHYVQVEPFRDVERSIPDSTRLVEVTSNSNQDGIDLTAYE